MRQGSQRVELWTTHTHQPMNTDPIPFAQVKRDDRVRIDYGDVQSLAEDLFVNGFIHPLCISQDNQLVAGGRRSRALDYILENYQKMVDDPELGPPHADMVQFVMKGELLYGVHYTRKSVEDLAKLSKLELIENVQRHNFSWQEEIIAVARIHSIESREKALEGSNWTQQHTGRLLGLSRANVSYCLSLAQHLKDENSPIWKCSGVVDALQYLAKLKHDEAARMLAEKVKAKASQVPNLTPGAPPPDLDKFIQSFDPNNFQDTSIANPSDEYAPVQNDSAAPRESAPITDVNKAVVEEAMGIATKIVHHMDCMEFFKTLGPESVDHIVTDPPYGIDMEMLDQAGGQGQKNIDRIAETHDVKQNVAAFPLWLQGCFDILKPKGFCVWFCDAMQWQRIYDEAIKVGFKVQRWPFVWVKSGSCINQRAEYNFTKATEFAMVMRKGDARLTSAQQTNYWVGSNTPEDRAAGVNHPFIKPKELWQHILKAVALPGSTIAEPFSGVGSGTRAMLLEGYMPLTCEIDANHYAQQINNVAKTYCDLKGVKF